MKSRARLLSPWSNRSLDTCSEGKLLKRSSGSASSCPEKFAVGLSSFARDDQTSPYESPQIKEASNMRIRRQPCRAERNGCRPHCSSILASNRGNGMSLVDHRAPRTAPFICLHHAWKGISLLRPCFQKPLRTRTLEVAVLCFTAVRQTPKLPRGLEKFAGGARMSPLNWRERGWAPSILPASLHQKELQTGRKDALRDALALNGTMGRSVSGRSRRLLKPSGGRF